MTCSKMFLFQVSGKAPFLDVNIIENDEMYKLELAAPGLAKEDFKISIENEVLSVVDRKEIRII